MTEKLISANLRNFEKNLKRVGEHSFMAQINAIVKLVLKPFNFIQFVHVMVGWSILKIFDEILF